MNPAPLQIGDVVQIVGPDWCDGKSRLNAIFQITEESCHGFSTAGQSWYPASSLRKVRIVEGDELQIGDEVEITGQPYGGFGWTIGAKGTIKETTLSGNYKVFDKWFPASRLRKLSEFQIGDYAEVVLPDNQFTGKIGQVSSIGELTIALYSMGIWSRGSLRKLTPDEIRNLPGTSVEGMIMARLSAIEKRQDNLVSILDRLANVVSAVELIQKEHIENHADAFALDRLFGGDEVDVTVGPIPEFIQRAPGLWTIDISHGNMHLLNSGRDGGKLGEWVKRMMEEDGKP